MYFRQPEYYSSFKCVGGECKYTCCAGWVIQWTREEIDKVKNAPACSEKLRTLMEECFQTSPVNEKNFMVTLGEKRRCPMLTDDNLCLIQKELGAEYLSNTCTSYPRVYRAALSANSKTFPYIYRFCNMSCPEVARRIITDKNAMNLVNVSANKNILLKNVRNDNEKRCGENPEYLYRTEIFEFFYGLISDKRYSVEAAIINGAIAAQIIKEIIEEKKYSEIPQVLNELHDGFIKGNMFRDIENIEPDYVMKIVLLSKIVNAIDRNNVINLLKNPEGKFELSLYKDGEAALSRMFGGDDYWLRNIALNLLMELSVPFYSDKFDVFDTYSLFLAAFAGIKLNAIACSCRGDVNIDATQSDGFGACFTSKEGIWGFASVVSRSFCQTTSKAESIVNVLKKLNFTTPRSLAVLIK